MCCSFMSKPCLARHIMAWCCRLLSLHLLLCMMLWFCDDQTQPWLFLSPIFHVQYLPRSSCKQLRRKLSSRWVLCKWLTCTPSVRSLFQLFQQSPAISRRVFFFVPSPIYTSAQVANHMYRRTSRKKYKCVSSAHNNAWNFCICILFCEKFTEKRSISKNCRILIFHGDRSSDSKGARLSIQFFLPFFFYAPWRYYAGCLFGEFSVKFVMKIS